jgi:hypothetical protein
MMTQTSAVWAVWVVAILAANLPFLTERVLIVGPRRKPKSMAWRLLELLVLGAGVLGAGSLLESTLGQRAPQEWPFFAAFACLFLTLGFPGFVWRYLRRAGGHG